MSIFNRRKSDMYDGYYDNYSKEEESEKLLKFPVLVGVAVALVVLVFVTIFLVNLQNGSFKKITNAAVRNFESGSFEYRVSVGVDDKTYMDYDGAIEFDLESQMLESSYHAVYEGYEYDSVTYANGADAVCGSYYVGKWSVENYTDKALDFFSFYRSIKKGKLDAGAFTRFTGLNDKLNAVQLENCVEYISDDLSGPYAQNNILRQTVVNDENGTTITYNPKNDELTSIILSNIASAFASAKEFEEFKNLIERNIGYLAQSQTVISFTINNDKYLTDIHIAHETDGKCYKIDVKMSNFSNAEVEIPNSFMTAIGKEN